MDNKANHVPIMLYITAGPEQYSVAASRWNYLACWLAHSMLISSICCFGFGKGPMSCFRNAPIPTKLDKESREVRVSYDDVKCNIGVYINDRSRPIE